MTDPFPINRIAVVLIPTQACLDWINSCDDDQLALDKIQQESTVFLLPEGRGEPESQVRRHFKEMFEEDLYSWYTRHWHEFVFKAYHHHQHEAIFLAGIPDVKSSLPHA